MSQPIQRPPRWKSYRDAGVFNAPNFTPNLTPSSSTTARKLLTPSTPGFSIAKTTPLSILPRNTTRWIRSANDERAAQEGARFSEEAGQFTVDWIEEHCCLYEGSKAGYLMELEDWQYEYFMQVFGWMKWSDDHNQVIRRYQKADIWIPKKNGKSPTAAATGLYLLIGDGEPGQKCFSAAKDGEQAKIAHRHAVAMVDKSPSLGYFCVINRSTLEIKYVPTDSIYSIVSGLNVKATQGFNGSILVDEMHVVPEKLIDSLKYAGISRVNPLFAQFSTAGDDATGYGANRWKFGEEVLAGRLYAPTTYIQMWQDREKTSIEEVYKPEVAEKIALRTNPAIGRLVFKGELKASHAEACHSMTELSRWLKYRTNRWTSGDSGWISMPDWNRCERAYTLESIKKRESKLGSKVPCVLGIDLSKTRDLSSLSAVFGLPNKTGGVTPITWTWTWTPQFTADKYLREHDINFREWEAYDLTICENRRTVDYAFIAARVRWLIDNFDVRGIGYDAWQASTLITIMDNEYSVDPELCFKVDQNMKCMSPLTAEFERLVLDNELRHNKSPVVDWQMGNVQLYTDINNNYKPVKPPGEDHRKIDSIVSLIIATGMFYLPEAEMTSKPLPILSTILSGKRGYEHTAKA